MGCPSVSEDFLSKPHCNAGLHQDSMSKKKFFEVFTTSTSYIVVELKY